MTLAVNSGIGLDSTLVAAQDNRISLIFSPTLMGIHQTSPSVVAANLAILWSVVSLDVVTSTQIRAA
jgi:hypothetical protein